jgi:hypothetical protein
MRRWFAFRNLAAWELLPGYPDPSDRLVRAAEQHAVDQFQFEQRQQLNKNNNRLPI